MTFEELRLIDLVEKFRKNISFIAKTRSLKKLGEAGASLQSVYNFVLACSLPFDEEEQELFKNLFSSFNYAALIVNDALSGGGLKGDDNVLLNECIEVLLTCCDKIINRLKNG